MDRLSAIAVEVESKAEPTGNILPLLHELCHALSRYREDGSEHIIDLNSLPMADEELRHLERLLGVGEVQAHMQALGDSEVTETRLPGIWRITHFNAERVVVGRFLEVTDCPAILKSQRQDVDSGIRDLEQIIDTYS